MDLEYCPWKRNDKEQICWQKITQVRRFKLMEKHNNLVTHQSLEKNQVLIYLAAILAGLAIGSGAPMFGEMLEIALWPILGLLLYVTFTQTPLSLLRETFVNPRFLVAAVLGNFVVLPVLVWMLIQLVQYEFAIRLGMVMVLLVPCTDWFITFTHLGGGDTKRAIAFAPLSLLIQIIMLPLYLWLFFGGQLTVTLARSEILVVFIGLILTPLCLAFLTQKWVEKVETRAAFLDRLGWLPVPLLALVVFIIAASQVNVVFDSGLLLGGVFLVYAAYLVLAALVARLLSEIFNLPHVQGRVLAFSFGTRNSFVILPIVLALPTSFEIAVVVVVFQSLVELFGMAAYLWWIPNRLFPIPLGKT
jgi:arsenite transporter